MNSKILKIAFCLVFIPSLALADTSTLQIDFELAEQDKQNYHEPYVAIWLETVERKNVATLAVWYRQKKGEKWLKDLRQWWRKAGSQNLQSIDAVTGATHKAGSYSIRWNGKDNQGVPVPKGHYVLHLEASREKAGREHLRLAIELPLNSDSELPITTNGRSEFGAISITQAQVD